MIQPGLRGLAQRVHLLADPLQVGLAADEVLQAERAGEHHRHRGDLAGARRPLGEQVQRRVRAVVQIGEQPPVRGPHVLGEGAGLAPVDLVDEQ